MRWQSQLINIGQHINYHNSVSFTNIEIIFAVFVPESHSQCTLCADTNPDVLFFFLQSHKDPT